MGRTFGGGSSNSAPGVSSLTNVSASQSWHRRQRISYRRGHQYLMVVVDHDSGRLVWAAAGHDRATLQKFFDLLGPNEPVVSS